MSLFPKCTFEVLLPDGVVRAGERAEGELVVDVPMPIPRAEHLELFFRTTAVAGYGSGQNRSVHRRDLLLIPMHLDIPPDVPFAVGRHRYPFTFEMPVWLPPNYSGADCSIQSTIEVRLDVDWAIDPKKIVTPVVVLPPLSGHASPLTTRSPTAFHESIVVEVTLDSAVVAHDQPVSGRIALRGGHSARFDALVLSVFSSARILMARGDRRLGGGLSIRVPKEALQAGESVPFAFPPNTSIPPTFRNGFIDHDVILRVAADIPWASDPSFELALQVLPNGSQVEHDRTQAGPVGAMRLRQLAAAMATATGLPVGRLPTLIEGTVGPTMVRVADSPQSGRIGVDIDLAFPDVDLGIVLRPLGIVEGFRQSPLLPTALSVQYLLRVTHDDRPPIDAAALGAFFHAVLSDLNAADLRLSDHHLGLHYVLVDDGATQMTQLALFATARAKLVSDAIARLPFPAALASAHPAWLATAREQSGFLVPHVPAIVGLLFQARILAGELRSMGAVIRTVWRKGTPAVVVDLDLREAPLPVSASQELENETGFAGVRALFPSIHALSREKVSLEADGWIPDPRALLPAVELFFAGVLEARGERRVDAPYR